MELPRGVSPLARVAGWSSAAAAAAARLLPRPLPLPPEALRGCAGLAADPGTGCGWAPAQGTVLGQLLPYVLHQWSKGGPAWTRGVEWGHALPCRGCRTGSGCLQDLGPGGAVLDLDHGAKTVSWLSWRC